jgi:uncharacterized protein YndB with AHSA1/START domain
MKPIEFELERTIRAPIDQVFARLVDIEGYNEWMAGSGSMLKRTRQTSTGEPTVGTTFVDETSQGVMPGDIAQMEPPHTLVYHWWETSRSGELTFEGWPSYQLEASGTARRSSAITPGWCRTACGASEPRSGDDWRSRNAPSPSMPSRRPSSE